MDYSGYKMIVFQTDSINKVNWLVKKLNQRGITYEAKLRPGKYEIRCNLTFQQKTYILERIKFHYSDIPHQTSPILHQNKKHI